MDGKYGGQYGWAVATAIHGMDIRDDTGREKRGQEMAADLQQIWSSAHMYADCDVKAKLTMYSALLALLPANMYLPQAFKQISIDNCQ